MARVPGTQERVVHHTDTSSHAAVGVCCAEEFGRDERVVLALTVGVPQVEIDGEALDLWTSAAALRRGRRGGGEEDEHRRHQRDGGQKTLQQHGSSFLVGASVTRCGLFLHYFGFVVNLFTVHKKTAYSMQLFSISNLFFIFESYIPYFHPAHRLFSSQHQLPCLSVRPMHHLYIALGMCLAC